MSNALNIMVVEDHDALRDITVEALAQPDKMQDASGASRD